MKLRSLWAALLAAAFLAASIRMYAVRFPV